MTKPEETEKISEDKKLKSAENNGTKREQQYQERRVKAVENENR